MIGTCTKEVLIGNEYEAVSLPCKLLDGHEGSHECFNDGWRLRWADYVELIDPSKEED